MASPLVVTGVNARTSANAFGTSTGAPACSLPLTPVVSGRKARFLSNQLREMTWV
jgi:hypothetical protein